MALVMPLAQDLMRELESLGSESHRKTYARHGVKEPMFGVSYAHLGMLTKRLKTQHELALELWSTGNHDARVLATMIADRKRVDMALIARWLEDIEDHGTGGALATLASESPVALDVFQAYRDHPGEWQGQLAWSTLGRLATYSEGVDPAIFEDGLAQIEREIHGRPNRTRYSMIAAVVAIGTRSEHLRDLALAAGERIGKVEVDHGPTSCKTPDPAREIPKAFAHAQAKREKAKKA